MPRLADSIVTAPHSGIREIGALAARVPDVIRLELGDPDFATPPHIIEAAREAALQGFTKYTPSAGLASLRELIAEKVQTRNRIVTVEDHYAAGGIGDAVAEAIAGAGFRVHRIAVREIPRSGKPEELLDKFGISAAHIVAAVKTVTVA